MGLLESYLKTLKPLEVEEPIDVWVHRPLAFVLAKVLYPTPVSPNFVTFMSIVFGMVAAYYLFCPGPHHLLWAGICIFLSAVVDCADGQLARMRGTSSAFGRMLDGVADGVVSLVIVVGGGWVVIRSHLGSPSELAVFVPMVVITAVTGSLHTGSYDHYKNLFLRLTHARYKEGEDYESALERRAATPEASQSFFVRVSWPVYLYYLKSQTDYVRRFDRFTTPRLAALPDYTPEAAAIYRRHNAGLMRTWRWLFGFGSMVFGFALGSALDKLDWYIVFRGFGLNILYFAVMGPLQRAASRDAFRELELTPP